MWELGRGGEGGEGGRQSETTGWHTRKHNGTHVAFCGVLDGAGLARWAGALERENANRGMPHQDAPSNRIERRIDLDSSGDCSLSKILVSMSAKCLAPVEPSLIFQ